MKAPGKVSWWWRAAPFVLVCWLPTCLLGGQTGDSAAFSNPGASAPCDDSRELGHDDDSSVGYTPATMLTRLGGKRTADITRWDAGFWAAYGIEEPQETPVPLTLTIAREPGSVFEDQCALRLSIPVTVSLDVGNGLITRSGKTTLRGDMQSAKLSLSLEPASCEGGTTCDRENDTDASAQVLTLELRLTPSEVHGDLTATGEGTSPSATFRSAP